MVVCRVALLDGRTFEPKGIDKNSMGQLLFEKVTKELDIIETDYFGLTFRDKSGKKFWLDNTKKISKQLKGGTWVFEFQVKFYPPDPMALKEDITRYQLSLQVRVDLFNGRLPCSFATYALLGSYTVQAELGDWEHKEYGDGIQYLHDFDFSPSQNQELLEKIQELHKNHKGQTPVVAEAYFLENAKKLAMYGVDMHEVKDFENKRLSLGICATGILVYKDRLRISRFVWPKILKLSYKRTSFYVKIRPGEFEPHERTISFQCDSHKLAKRLWKTCVEHHAFFRLKTADPPSQDTLFPRFNSRFRYSGRTAVQARKAAEMTNRQEPHITRTAERRSLVDKSKSLDDMAAQKKPYDENDMRDKKYGDDATLERDRNMAALNEKNQQKAPDKEDAADRLDHRPGEEPGSEGPPGYSADSAALDAAKKKKEKEDEKRRKKEEERRRKEEEKERKRLEKERKKKASQETAIDDVQPDAAVLEQLKEDYMQLLNETEGITSTSKLDDVKHKIDKDPRYKAVDSDARRRQWFDEYVDDMLKSDFMRLLCETPTIHSHSTWPESRQDIADDRRFQAVPTEEQREKWFNEYVQGLIKSEYMQLLKDTPAVHSQSWWEDVKDYVKYDPRYQAVPTDAQRQDWFDEYIQNLKKEEFMQLLSERPDITSYTHYKDVRDDICNDPRFQNVDTEAQREQYFNEYIQNLKKAGFMQLLSDTPDITSTSKWHESKHTLDTDPRYHAVDTDLQRARWFNEYVNNLLKSDFMRLLRETPTIHSQSTWPEARQEIDLDRRFQAVPTERQREIWFNEYVQGLIKSEFMQLLKDTPAVHSQSRWEDVKDYLEYDPRYHAVPTDAQRKTWFDEYIQNLKKEEFMELLSECPDITSYSHYNDVRERICNDPRFQNVDTEAQRQQYFNEYIQNLKKAGFIQLLKDTPDITSTSKWHESKHLLDTDPRYHAVDSDLKRAQWFNEYVDMLAGRGYGDVDYGLRIGGYKSIDRKQEFLPLTEPTVAKRTKSTDEPMPFFEPVGETDVDALGRKRVPPPVAKKPRAHSGYDSEEDRLLNSQTGVPVTVKTETYKYSPDMNDVPRSTSNIPIVETTTHKVTYEKDGVPYETEDSILISSHSVTTKSQTIDTTTYKTERDGVIETRVERKITVTSDENDDLDHDALLRAAIEEVTCMNPDLSVEKIECMRQIEEVNGK